MSFLTENFTDARQTPQWAAYMKGIEWIVEKIENNYIYIRKTPLFGRSIIKAPHITAQLSKQDLDQLVKKYNPLFILIEPNQRDYDEKFFRENGFQKSHMRVLFTATRLIDIRPPHAEIIKSFSENTRRNIKKAEKNNIRIENTLLESQQGEKVFDAFYKLYTHLGKLKNFYTLPYQECVIKKNAFIKNSFISLAYSSTQDEPIAAVWFGLCNNTLVYLQTGITKEGYELAANALLVSEGIKFGKQHGSTIFDFESIFDPRYPKENKKWQGYSEFKERFHGEIVQYPPGWIKIYNIPYKFLYTCASILSHS